MTMAEAQELLLDEQARLGECETVIERGLGTFVEVGTALAEIRDSRLYRHQFKTFEDYCRERWGFARNYANKQIAAAQTVREMESAMGTKVPITTERQTRAIAPVLREHGPEVAAQVLAEATREGQTLTAIRITEAAQTITKPHVANNSGDNEWYTPTHILETARTIHGHFDLDPASSPIANQRVQAHRIYTAQDNGLNHKWEGHVWLNPPYAQPLIAQFIDKACQSYTNCDIQSAIVLVNNGTETAWGQQLLRNARAVCFPSSRIRFLKPEGDAGAPLQGQMISYLGPEPERFRDAFTDIGAVL